MPVKRVITSFLVVCMAVVLVSETAQAYPPKKLTEYGSPVAMGDGAIRSFTTVNPAGKPLAIGIEIPGAAFQNLPTALSDGKWSYDGHTCCGHEHVLDLPDNADAMPFQWIMVNWNPGGHIPPGIYDLPHFDFHFYWMDESTRYDIEPGHCSLAPPGVLISCDSFAKGMEQLPADEFPPGYTNVGAVEAGMGAHLMDLSSPEWNGATFTRTFLYGAWKGTMTFMEPMITLAEMMKKEEEHCTPYPVPEAMPEAGYYPTEYCTRYIEGTDTHYVSLQSFQWFEASDGVLGN